MHAGGGGDRSERQIRDRLRVGVRFKDLHIDWWKLRSPKNAKGPNSEILYLALLVDGQGF